MSISNEHLFRYRKIQKVDKSNMILQLFLLGTARLVMRGGAR